MAGAYVRPGGLAGALTLMAERPFRPLAGGTDLYPATAAQTLAGAILDLTAIDELKGIELTGAGLRIGACESWDAIARAPLPAALACLQAAAREVGGRQIQNAGTIGGNLCNASPAADGVPPLLALDATVELASVRGARRLALDQFILGPRRTARAPDELLTAILIPRAALMGRSMFAKLGARRYLVISIAAVAVRLVEREGRVATACVAVGACSPVARRLPMVEAALEGARLDGAAARVRDADVAAALAPLDDIRASAAYRSGAAAELIRRAVAVLAVGTMAEGGVDG
ncbi:MAG: FAD binding domain-containing protein [Paracoccaceae bacterium]